MIQANEKVQRITIKKLDNILTSEKSFSNKTRFSYIEEGSSSVEPKREMKFVSEMVVRKPKVESPNLKNKAIAAKSKAKGKSLPKNQRGPQVKHFCYHCGIRGHTRPNCFKLHALKRADLQSAQGIEKGKPRGKQAKVDNGGQLIGDVKEMLNSISTCLASFTSRFERYIARTPPIKDHTQNTCVVWVKKVTPASSLYHVLARTPHIKDHTQNTCKTLCASSFS